MKDKIYLDFDRTLFNTDAFFTDLKKIIGSRISQSLFQKYYDKTIIKGFNPYNILEEIKKDTSINISETKKELDKFMNDLNRYVFEDTIPFLEKIKKNYEINLFTYGDLSFQKMKVMHTNIYPFISHFMDTLDNKSENKNINYLESIFIDDNPMVIDDLYQKHPKQLIRIRRKNVKYSDIDTKCKVLEVDSLKIINL